MNTQLMMSRSKLEHAEALLREVLRQDVTEVRGDAASLDRILVHIVNINQAVSLSEENHANAAKRLQDFAVTSTRMSQRNPAAAAELIQLADVLRAAGSGISAAITERSES